MASGLITQTNADGTPMVRANSTTIVQPKTANHQQPPGGGGLLAKLCCCFAPTTSHGHGGSGGGGYRSANSGPTAPLLKPLAPEDKTKKCLVLDLDETLVHSSFKPVPNPDYVIPVEIEGTVHHVYVLKRPGVDEFMRVAGNKYEIVLYTASLAKYADPLLDQLDIHKVIKHRLFRESCTCHEGNYVKDLSKLGRDLSKTIIVDNSPASYLFQPENAIGVTSFIDDPNDRELFYCLPFLDSIVDVENVVEWLHTYPGFIAKKEAEASALN